jgi:hypothetical protein
MAKHTRKSPGGTSFHNTTLYATVEELVALFPYSFTEENTGRDKTNYDFVLETESGDVFTIYDWKYYRPLLSTERLMWNIGGHKKEITVQAKLEVEALLSEIRVLK